MSRAILIHPYTNCWAMMRRAAIIDIDGTLALNAHRSEHLAKSPKDWDTFNSLMHLDEPNAPLVELLHYISDHYTIILCSGRQRCHWDVTRSWLETHKVPWHAAYLREDQDFRSDSIIKLELLAQIKLDGFDPRFVVDDRNSVVATWRAAGLLCLQGALGDF